MIAKTPHFERNRKISAFAIAFAIVGLFSVAFGVANDFVLNADWKNEELTKYGEFGKGIWLAEARYDVNNDFIHIIGSGFGNTNKTTIAYYKDFIILPALIKYNKGKGWALPHELGHHYFYRRMNTTERENWCNTFDWANWSYDGTCDEGFAEFFGMEIIQENRTVVSIVEGIFSDENHIIKIDENLTKFEVVDVLKN